MSSQLNSTYPPDNALKAQNMFEDDNEDYDDIKSFVHAFDRDSGFNLGDRPPKDEHYVFHTTCARSQETDQNGFWKAKLEEPQELKSVFVLVDFD